MPASAVCSWSAPPTAYRFQWLRSNGRGGSCVRISRATRSTYRVAKRDARHRLRVRVTAGDLPVECPEGFLCCDEARACVDDIGPGGVKGHLEAVEREHDPGARAVDVRQVEDFEGVVQLALGVSGATCYRAFTLTNPDRLGIDIKA